LFIHITLYNHGCPLSWSTCDNWPLGDGGGRDPSWTLGQVT